MTQLTTNILAMYPGCQVKALVPYDKGTPKWVKARLKGIVENTIILRCRDIYDVEWAEDYTTQDLKEIRLLLRPLSDMSDEEKTEYNKRKQRKGYMPQVHAENTLWLTERGFDALGGIASGWAETL